jgi:hypothetical protein
MKGFSMKRYIPALAGALVLASTLAASAATVPTQFRLSPQNGSGERATATLLQGADSVIVRVRTSGQGADPQPIHIHKGTCATLDPKPAFPLTTLQNGISETHVKGITLAQLESGAYAINVHKSVKEVATYVACGDLKKSAAI